MGSVPLGPEQLQYGLSYPVCECGFHFTSSIHGPILHSNADPYFSFGSAVYLTPDGKRVFVSAPVGSGAPDTDVINNYKQGYISILSYNAKTKALAETQRLLAPPGFMNYTWFGYDMVLDPTFKVMAAGDVRAGRIVSVFARLLFGCNDGMCMHRIDRRLTARCIDIPLFLTHVQSSSMVRSLRCVLMKCLTTLQVCTPRDSRPMLAHAHLVH